MSNPVASIEIAAKSAGLSAQLREVRAQFGSFADGVAEKFISAANKAKKTGFGKGFGGAMSVAGGTLMAGAISRVSNAVEEGAEGVRDFERGLTRFGIAARQSPAQLGALRDSIADVSKETGLGREEILGAARAYVDLAGAENFNVATMRLIARTAQASGAAVGDVATTVYSLGDAMHIKPDEMEAALSGLINQSKDGAVHFNQFAEEIVGIAPRFARFGVLGKEGTLQFGAMFQVMRSGFKDAAETGTGMSGMFKGLIMHADRFAEAGVSVYNVGKNGQKTLKPVLEILKAISHSSLAKDPTALLKAFGRGEGEQAFQMFTKHLDLFNQLITAGHEAGVVEQDLAAYTTSDAGKIDLAFNSAKVAIAEAFTPDRIKSFTEAIVALAEKIGPVVGFVEKIGGVLGSVEGVGEKVRDVFSGGDARSLSAEDRDTLNAAQGMREKGFDISQATPEFQRKYASASKAKSDIDEFNLTARNIMDGENNGRSSPESIRRAIRAHNEMDSGASRDAGGAYLKAAGIQDPLYALRDSLNALRLSIAKGLLDKAVAVAVQVGADTVAKATKVAPVHRRNVAK